MITDEKCAEHEQLIREAQLWATGATIHDVNGMIGSIRGWVDVLKLKNPSRTMGCTIAEVEANLSREMKTLRAFMRHGDYKRARRENPPPGGWSKGAYGT